MKRALVLIAMFGLAAPAHADVSHKLSSSVQLSVNSAATQATRIGSSYQVSGSGVATTDGTTNNTVSTGAITSGVMSPGNIAATQVTSGNAFSYSASYTQADAVPTSAVTVGDVGLGKAGQIPLLPTEGVVQRQRRAGDFARGTGGCRGPNHAGLGESAARIGRNRG